MKQLGWHFLPSDRRLSYKPRRLVKPGMTLRRGPKKIKLCAYGLHWSKRPLNALSYASGPVVCRVECGGKTIMGSGQSVSAVRKVLWMADATDALRGFARWCALQVIDGWSAPNIVHKYLETGDEEIREAAMKAAWDASWNVVWPMGLDPAIDAVCAATLDSAIDAAQGALYEAIKAGMPEDTANVKLEEMLMALGTEVNNE